jgi:hypothetical protein
LTRRSDPPRAKAALQAARKSSDVDEAVLSMGRMQDSFTISGLRPRSSAALRKTPNAY